jgi:hypothetical protein
VFAFVAVVTVVLVVVAAVAEGTRTESSAIDLV